MKYRPHGCYFKVFRKGVGKLTMKISVSSGQLIDMAKDTVRINLIEKARLVGEGALSLQIRREIKRIRPRISILSAFFRKILLTITGSFRKPKFF